MGKGKGKARAKNSRKERMKKKNDFFIRRKRTLSSIRKWNDEVLTKQCGSVEEWEDVSPIIKQMKTVLRLSKNGVGLAASQISHLKAIIALRPDKGKDIRILINPEITDKSEEKGEVKEGCLSYPDFYTEIERYARVKVSYLNEKKEKKEEEFRGMESVIVQHEIDHLSGICKVGQAWKNQQNKDSEENDKVNAVHTGVLEEQQPK